MMKSAVCMLDQILGYLSQLTGSINPDKFIDMYYDFFLCHQRVIRCNLRGINLLSNDLRYSVRTYMP